MMPTFSPGALRLAVALGAATAAGACANSTEPPGPPARLEVAPAAVTLRQGETRRLDARVLDANGRVVPGVAITFTSADPGIVTVSASGLLMGVHGGATDVSVQSGDLGITVSVAVFGHPAGVVVVTRVLSGTPFAATASAGGTIYVSRTSVARLQRVNLPGTQFTDSVAVGSVPTDVAFDSTGTTAFVTNQLDMNVGVVDVASNIQVGTVPLPADPFRVVVSHDDREVYVSANNGDVYILMRTGDGAQVAPLGPPRAVAANGGLTAAANGLALHPTQPLLYVSFVDGQVVELNTATRMVSRTFLVGGTAQDVAVTRDGTELFVANESGALAVVDLGSGAVGSVPEVANAFGLEISPDDAQVYATLPGAAQLKILDRATRTVLHTIATGAVPRRIAFDRYGTTAVVATESGSVHFVR